MPLHWSPEPTKDCEEFAAPSPPLAPPSQPGRRRFVFVEHTLALFDWQFRLQDFHRLINSRQGRLGRKPETGMAFAVIPVRVRRPSRFRPLSDSNFIPAFHIHFLDPQLTARGTPRPLRCELDRGMRRGGRSRGIGRPFHYRLLRVSIGALRR